MGLDRMIYAFNVHVMHLLNECFMKFFFHVFQVLLFICAAFIFHFSCVYIDIPSYRMIATHALRCTSFTERKKETEYQRHIYCVVYSYEALALVRIPIHGYHRTLCVDNFRTQNNVKINYILSFVFLSFHSSHYFCELSHCLSWLK